MLRPSSNIDLFRSIDSSLWNGIENNLSDSLVVITQKPRNLQRLVAHVCSVAS